MRQASFLWILWERLKRSLRVSRSEEPFQLDQDLLQTLQGLAQQERRPAEDVAADLLSFALAQQHVNRELLEYWESLTFREQQVAALLCLGYTNRQMAARLALSPNTIKSHVQHVLYKFGVNSRSQLRMMLSEWDFSRWEQTLR